MSKYTVYFLTPYCSWENVEAKSKKEAIDKCESPSEFDMNEIVTYIAIEEEE